MDLGMEMKCAQFNRQHAALRQFAMRLQAAKKAGKVRGSDTSTTSSISSLRHRTRSGSKHSQMWASKQMVPQCAAILLSRPVWSLVSASHFLRLVQARV